MSVLDFKKEYKDLYAPSAVPTLINVPVMRFIMVDGKGNPNDEEGEYSSAIELLYGLSYTIKMSPKSGPAPEGYFEYVVPPLEGLWWIDDNSMDFTQKDKYLWTMMIRQPDFADETVFEAAKETLSRKKKNPDLSKARFVTWQEGLCVQIMHIGPYEDEPASVAKIDAYIRENGLYDDIGEARRHHEIYLGDPRKTAPEKRKTILRHPVRR